MRFDVLASVACQPTWGQQFCNADAVCFDCKNLVTGTSAKNSENN